MAKFHGVEMTVVHQFYTGGWKCAVCDRYVPYGNLPHYCWGTTNWYDYPSQSTTPQIQYSFQDPTLIELQNLLRQLIEKVDQLIEKIEQ